MTYEEAEKVRDKNISLTGNYSQLKEVPFYIRFLVIGPKDKKMEELMDVLMESTTNNFDNKMPLFALGWLSKDLDVFIVFDDMGIFSRLLLSDYLNRLGKE